MDLVIFGFLVWLARGLVRDSRTGRWRFGWQPRYPRDGMLFWCYVGLYSLGRFFIQFYRVDTPFALGLSQAQLLSILTAMVAVWVLVYQANRARRAGPERPLPVVAPAAAEPAAAPTTPTVTETVAAQAAVEPPAEAAAPPRRRRARRATNSS
jgi:hypothetical protein